MGNTPQILGITVFALLTAVNLIYLDIAVMSQLGKPKETAAIDVSCPQSCLSKMQEIPIAPTPTTVMPPIAATISPSGVREFFVPFGSGSGSAKEWSDVEGLSATINTSNYARMKTVTFEVAIRIPTGNQTAYARLFNVTDKHPVWFSDVSVEGGKALLVISQPLSLDSGSKTYQVQLKNSLGYLSYIDQSRLRIITQ